MNWIELIILSVSTAAFGMQVAISELSEKVKKALYLQQPYSLSYASNIYFWASLVGFNTFLLLSPLFLVITLIAKIHKFVSELLSCGYCTTIWLMFIVNYLYIGLDPVSSIMYAPLSLIWVTVIDKLMR